MSALVLTLANRSRFLFAPFLIKFPLSKEAPISSFKVLKIISLRETRDSLSDFETVSIEIAYEGEFENNQMSGNFQQPCS